ncbi:hypothetical protein D3C73_497580 [compost metagenome]
MTAESCLWTIAKDGCCGQCMYDHHFKIGIILQYLKSCLIDLHFHRIDLKMGQCQVHPRKIRITAHLGEIDIGQCILMEFHDAWLKIKTHSAIIIT